MAYTPAYIASIMATQYWIHMSWRLLRWERLLTIASGKNSVACTLKGAVLDVCDGSDFNGELMPLDLKLPRITQSLHLQDNIMIKMLQ